MNPRRTAFEVSAVTNRTTGPPTLLPSMMVTRGPLALATVIALPMKLIVSLYVPAATRTVSPFAAALIPAWIVGWSAGIWMVAENAAETAPPRTASTVVNNFEQATMFVFIDNLS